MNALTAIIAALGGTGALGALLTALISFIKAKTVAKEAQAAALDRKKEAGEAHEKMAADMVALAADLAEVKASVQKETAELRAQLTAKDRRIASLERQLGAALALKASAEKI